jgi:hypothetical protein
MDFLRGNAARKKKCADPGFVKYYSQYQALCVRQVNSGS